MTTDIHEARKAAVYEAALQLAAHGISPRDMKIQQLADTAGIGKGTVYGYFASKEEILNGLASYCFAQECGRIRTLLADCATLAGLEERIAAYLQDIAASRMGSYKMIAEALGRPDCDGTIPPHAVELREIVGGVVHRLQAAGEIDPALSAEYCYMAIFSAVVGGLAGLCYAAETHRTGTLLPENLHGMLHRMLCPQK